ncbi:cryptochrome/photolyase family protein [Thalassospira marina]|uniref:Cryptochrome/photolyase family protein n=1 Tax=Thalassospira marina TaxID=2048283 RepID=A0A2N3KZG5_9PROT|nr:cryptochrome/photolyase family protein [Thalassospira marina]PKR55856.1 cryptochrome/photolyase family protein [Thalassospira marina]
MGTLRVILGDQLYQTITSLAGCDKSRDVILMCEVWDEATYVAHHKKKIAFLFSAMRHFAQDLQKAGYKVDYTKLDDGENAGSFQGEVKRAIARHSIDRIIITHPGEYRVLQDIETWQETFGLPVEIREDDRFLCGLDEFRDWAKGRKQLRMEFFYREMRKKHGILLENGNPAGGQWNFDAENRKPPKDGLDIPTPHQSRPDDITSDVLDLVEARFDSHFGDLRPFHFAVTRQQALNALDQFITQRLSQFGDYQDAMIQNQPWMFHSHLAFYLNCGLLLPLECIRAAENAWHRGDAPLNAVEGFIRQILGWREYVRGVYWLKMPGYGDENFFEANAPLPEFYWSANTKMNCLRQCVLETRKNAYAHHIQRLMVLGNFALLAGVSPAEVNEWFLIVYADAFEWVEMPNVSGMILFADGGFLASKPYAAGGGYISKMSNYCDNCSYQVGKKNGPKACPFNYLYWDFLARNRAKLADNQRVGMMYKTYDRMGDDKKQAITDDASRFLKSLS